MANQESFEPWNHLGAKVILVTGASSGLGREFCLDLAKAGCRIVAAARRVDRLKSLCDEINQLFSSSSNSSMVNSDSKSFRAMAVELDVTADAPTIQMSVQRAWDAFGQVDALVNNAGMRGKISSSLDLPEEEWNTTLRTNLTGAWLVAKYVGLKMREACRGGSIINISSVSGLNRALTRGGVAYGSSKAGMDSMTRIMALELGEYNIRVNSICPGLFRSEITEGLIGQDWIKKCGQKNNSIKNLWHNRSCSHITFTLSDA